MTTTDRLIAGVDEVGRGPLAGPVVTAAVILDPEYPIEGIKDSKLLSEKLRDRLYDEITQNAIAWSIGRCEVDEIDELNILQASLLAMRKAVLALDIKPDTVLVDGRDKPNLDGDVQAIIGGDKTVKVIGAASIIAKVTRDRELKQYEKLYPGYDLANNKGYGTKKHMAALQELGATPIHRKSFAPVRKVLTLA